MKERLIIILVAIIAGLFITSAGFFIYQSTQKAADNEGKSKKTNEIRPTPQPTGNLFIKVNEPANEVVVDRRTLQVKGSTNSENVVVASTNIEDVTVKPTQDGNFTLTIQIDAGANILLVRSIAPNGEQVSDTKTITYSTEEF